MRSLEALLAAGILGLGFQVAAPAADAFVFDDFDDGNLDGWTHDLPTAGASITPVNGAMAVQLVDILPDPAPLRASSERQGGSEVFSDVVVAVDVSGWDDAENAGFAVIARGSGYSANPRSGVTIGWDTLGRLTLGWLEDLQPHPILFDPTVALDESETHRLVLEVKGNAPLRVTGAVFAHSDLTTPIARIATPYGTSWPMGYSGVHAFEAGGGGSPLVVFDDFFADEPEGDADADGLASSDELLLIGTNPWEADTDGDGLTDGDEVGTGVFAASQIVSTAADEVGAIFAADLDGDGDLDVLSASNSDDEIAWYENTDGQGSFGAQQIISTAGDFPQSVFAADLDGDGDLDVLSASSLDDEIAWYENTDGEGTFSAQQLISVAANNALSVFAGDVDGDGDLDVLSASALDDKIAWYENTDGQGSFTSEQVISTAADVAQSVFAADLDGDDDLDVLSASFNDDEIAWYENGDGQGGFSAQQVISTAANGAKIAVAADLDGDGDLDVLSASALDDEIAWYENTDGQGSFGAQQVISTAANSPFGLFAADLDGDGDVDVLSASTVDDEVAWYENTDGQGSFATQQILSTSGDGAWEVVAADLDSDGDLDVLFASGNDDEIAWSEQLEIGEPLDPDSDDDGLLDGFEVDNGFDPLDAGEQTQDPDGDGLSNLGEQAAGSDPHLADSDGDGYGDGVEVAAGTDPLDPQDFPASVPGLAPSGLGALCALLLSLGGRAARRGAGRRTDDTPRGD